MYHTECHFCFRIQQRSSQNEASLSTIIPSPLMTESIREEEEEEKEKKKRKRRS
jgi:hypothetical protein